jgi:hypothetical protein
MSVAVYGTGLRDQFMYRRKQKVSFAYAVSDRVQALLKTRGGYRRVPTRSRASLFRKRSRCAAAIAFGSGAMANHLEDRLRRMSICAITAGVR